MVAAGPALGAIWLPVCRGGGRTEAGELGFFFRRGTEGDWR